MVIWVLHDVVFAEKLVTLDLKHHVINLEIWKISMLDTVNYVDKMHLWLVFKRNAIVFQPDVECNFRSRVKEAAVIPVLRFLLAFDFWDLRRVYDAISIFLFNSSLILMQASFTFHVVVYAIVLLKC